MESELEEGRKGVLGNSRPCVHCVSACASACGIPCICVTCCCHPSCVPAFVHVSVSIWVHGSGGSRGRHWGQHLKDTQTEPGRALRVWTGRQVKSG